MLQALKPITGCGNCDEADVRNWIKLDDEDQGYQLQMTKKLYSFSLKKTE